MKDEEKKVNTAEEVKNEEEGKELTDEELSSVAAGGSSSYDGESSEFRSQRARRDPSHMV